MMVPATPRRKNDKGNATPTILEMPRMRRLLVRGLVPLIMLLCSDDILFVVDVAGQSVRLSQVLEVLLIVLAVIDGVWRKRVPSPLGLMIAVFAMNTAFIGTTPAVVKSIGYDGWLLVDIMTAWAFAHFIGKAYKPYELVRWYVMSFTAMAVFGIVQLILLRIGINLLVAQRFVSGEGRINGLCFEPSYYSTYLLGGWAICVSLMDSSGNSDNEADTRPFRWQLVVISAALLLSTSKLAWMGMLFWIAFKAVSRIVAFFKRSRLTKRQVIALAVLPLVIAGGVLVVRGLLQNESIVSKYFSGSGLLGTSSHSYVDRINRFLITWQTFREHMIIGTSLGAIDWVISQHHTMAASTGLVIGSILEFGIGTGLIGLLTSVVFFVELLLRLPKRRNRSLLNACAEGGALQLVVLQANQNILRVWLWVGIGVVLALLSASDLDDGINRPEGFRTDAQTFGRMTYTFNRTGVHKKGKTDA